MTPSDLTRLDAQLHGLHLHYIQSHYQALATKAAEQQRSHLDYLAQLVEGEAAMHENRSIERRIKNARFPVLKSCPSLATKHISPHVLRHYLAFRTM
jgi:DNA replication protein DnaC